ncbi:MAG: hypothetical protein HQK51_05075 [Oligoflexia bacterium]|nr:hypothetical protein [Oligoflexia bacterium]
MDFFKNIYFEIKNDFKKKIFLVFIILIIFEGILVSLANLWIVNKTLAFNHISLEVIHGILFKLTIAKFALFILSILILSLIINFLLLKRIDQRFKSNN